MKVNTRIMKALSSPRSLLTEMEYRDPNGETYRAQGRSVLWPAAVALGIKAEYWASGKERKVELVAINPNGQPVPNAQITVRGGFNGSLWHRRKAMGGYYGYHHQVVAYQPTELCVGRADLKSMTLPVSAAISSVRRLK